jgi:hypothetical protein
MNQMDLNWNTDEFHKLTVTFSYTKWMQLDPPPLPAPTNTEFKNPFFVRGISLDDREYNPANDPNNLNLTPEQARALANKILLDSSPGTGIGGNAAR